MLVALLLVDKYPEILLKLLVHLLYLSIYLEVLGHTQYNLNSKQMIEFLDKEYYKL